MTRPEGVDVLFTEEVEWEIAGDVGALPWIGHRTGRAAVMALIRDSGRLLERLKFNVIDILASDTRAVILGELASRVKANGKVIETAFAVVLTISESKITHFRMVEDSPCCSCLVGFPLNPSEYMGLAKPDLSQIPS